MTPFRRSFIVIVITLVVMYRLYMLEQFAIHYDVMCIRVGGVLNRIQITFPEAVPYMWKALCCLHVGHLEMCQVTYSLPHFVGFGR